jgi:hypothetical protein
MKTRNGFISNSSSSSFIVIDRKSDFVATKRSRKAVKVGYAGHKEFGWEPNDYYDTDSKMNFAFLQAIYAQREDWREMLEKVIKDHTGAQAVEFNEEPGPYTSEFGYIDHQSSASEGSNTEMFDDDASLRDFLFRTGSYIHTDNDNH